MRLNSNEIVRLYLVEKLSTTQISDIFKCHPSTICVYLKKAGISTRSQSEQKKLYPCTQLVHSTPHTEETIQKMSQTLKQRYKEGKIKIWNKGKTGVYSKETLKLMSEKSKGRIAWNKGKNLSQEQVEEMRKRKISPDKLAIMRCNGFGFKKGIIPWNKGKTGIYSLETKLKISNGLKNYYSSIKHIKKIRSRRFSPEHIEKLRNSHLGKKLSIEQRKKISLAHLGKKSPKNSEYMRRLIVEGKYVSPMKNPETVKKMLHTLYQSPNKSELKLNEILNKTCPSEFKYVGNGDFVIGGRCPDFLNVNGRKIVIELFGEPFHDPNYKYPFKDKKMDISRTYEATMAHYSKYGFSTLIIWHKELINEAVVCDKIKTFMEANNNGKT